MGSGQELSAPLGAIALNAIDLAATPLGDIAQQDVDDAIGCTVDCQTTLAARQADDPAAFADVTLGDLLASARAPAGLARVFTLQQLLPGIVPAAELSPEAAFSLDALLHRSTTNGDPVVVSTSFTIECDADQPARIAVDAPQLAYAGGGAIWLGEHGDDEAQPRFSARASRGRRRHADVHADARRGGSTGGAVGAVRRQAARRGGDVLRRGPRDEARPRGVSARR